MTQTPTYDVALSLASEDRPRVAPIADYIMARGARVFYDDAVRADLWGRELESHLTAVFLNWSRFAVVFLSSSYRDKRWPQLELRAALVRAMSERRDYLLPVRIDDTQLDIIPPDTAYLDLRQQTPAEIGVLLARKLGLPEPAKRDEVPSPWTPVESGTIRFDYSSHNGRHRIGSGLWLFETAWSKASDRAIHCYNDPPSIKGLAVIPAGTPPSALQDVTTFDFSSRSRTPQTGQFVILENNNGFFALLRICEIKDSSRGAECDQVTFAFWINRDGGYDFSKASAA